MGQTSGAGIQLAVSEADPWPPSAELTVGSPQDDTTTDTLRRHTLAWVTCKSGCSLLDRSQAQWRNVCLWALVLREQVNHEGSKQLRLCDRISDRNLEEGRSSGERRGTSDSIPSI